MVDQPCGSDFIGKFLIVKVAKQCWPELRFVFFVTLLKHTLCQNMMRQLQTLQLPHKLVYQPLNSHINYIITSPALCHKSLIIL